MTFFWTSDVCDGKVDFEVTLVHWTREIISLFQSPNMQWSVCDQNKHLPVKYAAVDFTEETMLSCQYEHRLGNRKQYRPPVMHHCWVSSQINLFIPGII